MSEEPPEIPEFYPDRDPEPSEYEAWKQATPLSVIVDERLADLRRDPEDEAVWDCDAPGTYDKWRRRRVEQLLKAEVMLGLHAVYAAPRSDRPDKVNEIHPDYFVEVEFDSANNTAVGEERGLIEVRLKLNAGQPGAGKPREPGRPSHGKLITEAITNCTRDSDWFWKPRQHRFSTYLKFVNARLSDAARQYGLDEKTLEKHETAFRKKHGR